MADGTGSNQGTFRQTAIGLLALAGLWNAVYWLWPVHREAPVVMASTAEEPQEPDAAAEDADEPLAIVDAAPIEPQLPEVIADPAPGIVDPIVHDGGGLGVLPPLFEYYTTKSSDRNLGDIASRFYGDKSKAPIIAQANPYKDPRRLTAGQVWRIPLDPDNIQGIVVDADGNPADPPPTEPPPADYTEYVVQGGDTLGGISRMHYQTTRHAQFIYAFNRERLGLTSIRGIRPGQVLHIPKEPK